MVTKLISLPVICLTISACNYNYHIKRENFQADVVEGFARSYVFTEVKDAQGKPVAGSGKLTICAGYSGLVANLMQDAAIVGSAALIGQGIGRSGSRTTNNLNNASRSDASSVSQASAAAHATATSSSAHFPAAQPPAIPGHPAPPPTPSGNWSGNPQPIPNHHPGHDGHHFVEPNKMEFHELNPQEVDAIYQE